MDLSSTRITFIGGGNMASAIMGGLLQRGLPAANMKVAEPWDVARAKVESAFGVETTPDNLTALRTHTPTVVILAVKPQVMRAVAQQLAPVLAEVDPLVVTIAAGIRLQDLARWASVGEGHVPKCVRVMPNTPALLNEGATGLFAPPHVGEELRALAYDVMASVSKLTYWVERESLLDVVTGVSGSGPAYFFLMVEAMIKAGVAQGLPEEVARGLTIQTCLGAGRMLANPGSPSPEQLRKSVTSPNGTTEAALKYFASQDLEGIVHRAVQVASERATELGETLASSL